MSVSNLIRLGALATMVSGVLLLADSLGLFLGSGAYWPRLYVLSWVLLVSALGLVPVGMVGFHVLQRHTYGRMGRAAFWLVVVGSVVMLLGGAIFFTLGQAGDFSQASPPLGWVAVGLVGLVGGCVADSMIRVAPEDMKRGCHTDYYLWVIPVGNTYCAD